MGVYFIGFGTENLSRTILSQLGKENLGRDELPYTVDTIIAVNKALIETGFDPTCIRHNLIFTSPQSTLAEVKESLLLIYIAPVFNSVPEYFGNGWGNNRYGLLRPGIDSVWNHVDTLLHAHEYTGDDIARLYCFSPETPEYKVSTKMLTYEDPSLPKLADQFGYPTFYRYAQEAFLDAHCTEDEIRQAVVQWQSDSSGEMSALAVIINRYEELFRGASLLAILKKIKSHMVSLKQLSFIDYKNLIEKHADLPVLFSRCHVDELVIKGIQYTVPGSFEPRKAMRYFSDASTLAFLIKDITEKSPRLYDAADLEEISSIVCASSPLSNQEKIETLRAKGFRKAAIYLDSIATKKRFPDEEGRLIERIAYPDSQVFEYIRHLFATVSDEELFDLVVRKMNERKTVLAEAVKELVCERMGIEQGEYNFYVKTVKEYENARVYFCESGLFAHLRNPNRAMASQAISELLGRLESEDNPYVIRCVALNLLDIASQEGLLSAGAFITTGEVINKIKRSLNSSDHDTRCFMPTPALALLDVGAYNYERLRLVARKANEFNVPIPMPIRQLLSLGNWVYIRNDKHEIHVAGTHERECSFIAEFAPKMYFGNNTVLFDSWIGRFSELSGKHRLAVIDEIKRLWDDVADYPLHTRYLTHYAEEFLFVMPLVKHLRDNPNAVSLHIATGMEPFFIASFLLSTSLGQVALSVAVADNRLRFIPVTRRFGVKGPSDMLAQTIISQLSLAELQQRVSEETLCQIDQAIGQRQLPSSLYDTHAMRGMSLREAIVYICTRDVNSEFDRFFGLKAKLKEIRDLFYSYNFENGSRSFCTASELIEFLASKIEISAQQRRFLTDYLTAIGSEEGTLSFQQQELLYVLLLLWWSSAQTHDFRSIISEIYRATPLLNILLRDTSFGVALGPHPLVVDDMATSGKSFLLAELMSRAFAADISCCQYWNISQRVGLFKRIVEENGMLDNVLTTNIWLGEDSFGLYHGLFVSGDNGKRFKSYRALGSSFRRRQEAIEARLVRGEGNTAALERYSVLLDEFIAAYPELFAFVDAVTTLQHDSLAVKRQILKTIIRRDDPEHYIDQIIMDDFLTGYTPFEARFAGRDFLARNIGSLSKTLQYPLYADSLARLVTQDEMVRNIDRALFFEAHSEAATLHTLDQLSTYMRISTDPALRANFGKYLQGEITFAEFSQQFYSSYRGFDRTVSFSSRKIYLSPSGATPYYSMTFHSTDNYRMDIFSRRGFKLAARNTDSIYRQAFEESQSEANNRFSFLNGFAVLAESSQSLLIREMGYQAQRVAERLDTTFRISDQEVATESSSPITDAGLERLFRRLQAEEERYTQATRQGHSGDHRALFNNIIKIKADILIYAATHNKDDQRCLQLAEDLKVIGTEQSIIQRALIMYYRYLKREGKGTVLSNVLENFHIDGERNCFTFDSITSFLSEGDAPSGFASLFSGKNVMLIETHPDDILNNIGVLARAAKGYAQRVTYVTAVPDDYGVTDEYILMHEGVRSSGQDMVMRKRAIRSSEGRDCVRAMGIDTDPNAREYVNLNLDIPFAEAHYSGNNIFLPKDSLCAELSVSDQARIEELVKNSPADIYFMVSPFSFHPQHRMVTRAFLAAIYKFNKKAHIFFWQDYEEQELVPLPQTMFFFFAEQAEQWKEGVFKSSFHSQSQRKGESFYPWVCNTTARHSAQLGYKEMRERAPLEKGKYPYAERLCGVRFSTFLTGEKHLARAMEPNPDVPSSIVGVRRYIEDSHFHKSYKYEIPHATFMQLSWGKYLTREMQDRLALRLYRASAEPLYSYGGRSGIRLQDALSTQEMEALYLDLFEHLIDERYFRAILGNIKRDNDQLDERAKALCDLCTREVDDRDFERWLLASCLAEMLPGFSDDAFAGFLAGNSAFAIDESDKYVTQLHTVCAQEGRTFLHVVSYHGAIIFDLEVFALRLFKHWFRMHHPELIDGASWDNPDNLRRLLLKEEIRDSCIKVVFAVKNIRSVPTEVTEEDLEIILRDPRFAALSVFREFGLFRIINTGSQTPGMNLNDASGSFVRNLEEADFISIKGGNNTLTARFLNKNHFVLGAAVDFGIQRYTGLTFDDDTDELPACYVAYIPGGIPAVPNLRFSIPIKQNLSQFVAARRSFEERGPPLSLEAIRSRIDRYGDCFIEVVSPEVLGETGEAQEAFRFVREIADRENISYAEALAVYIDRYAAQDIRDAVYVYSVEELNLAFNLRLAMNILGAHGCRLSRTAYALNQPLVGSGGVFGRNPGENIGGKLPDGNAYTRCGLNKVVVTYVLLPADAIGQRAVEFSVVEDGLNGHKLITPVQAAERDFTNDEEGLLFNLLFYMSDYTRRSYNILSRQVELGEDSFTRNAYTGFQKSQATGEVFAPLYHKGAFAYFDDGRIEFRRVRLGEGGLAVNGNCAMLWIPFDRVRRGDNPEAIAYTPMYDQNLRENGVTHIGPHYDATDKKTAAEGKQKRRVFTPPDEQRVHFVIIRNKIIQIRQSQAEIPPFGWVLAVRKDIFEKFKKALRGDLRIQYDKDGQEFYTLPMEEVIRFHYDGLPAGWDKASFIAGEGYLIYDEQEGRRPITQILTT